MLSGDHAADNRIDVGLCAVDGRKACFAFIEGQVEAGNGEEDRLDAVAAHERW